MNKFTVIAAALVIAGVATAGSEPQFREGRTVTVSEPTMAQVINFNNKTGGAVLAGGKAPSRVGQSVGNADDSYDGEVEHFGGLDANGDGFLSREEVANNPRLSRAFDYIDFNADELLSREELMQVHREARTRRAAMEERAFGMYMRFTALDDDGDGGLTLDEIGDKLPKIREHFHRIDKNADGKVTLKEIREFGDAVRAAASMETDGL